MLRRLFLFSFLLHSTLAQKPAGPHHPIAPHQPVVPNPIPVKKWSTLSGW